MLIRNAFITNSSSTSFIFYGVNFGGENADELFEKVVPPEKRSTREDYGDMAETLCNWADDLRGDICVKVDWEDLSGQVYARDSFWRLSDGVCQLPVEHITSYAEEEDMWTKKILDFCAEYGIKPHAGHRKDRDESVPSWRVAVDVNQ